VAALARTRASATSNPQNVDTVLSGDGQTVLGTALGVRPRRQQPGAYSFGVLSGIFDATSAENPFKDWNMVYVPYCTGDVHFGTKKNGTVPGVTTPQQFVGYLNMQKFVGRIVPPSKTRSTAWSSPVRALELRRGAQPQHGPGRLRRRRQGRRAARFGRTVQRQVYAACMQKRWREGWGFADALPSDCTECKQADGGGMIRMADFLIKKHPNSTLAAVTSIHDEVIRLFFSVGVKNCANFDTVDPVDDHHGSSPRSDHPLRLGRLRSRDAGAPQHVQEQRSLRDLLHGRRQRHRAPAHLSRSLHRPRGRQ
jgi:hypothetical protein